MSYVYSQIKDRPIDFYSMAVQMYGINLIEDFVFGYALGGHCQLLKNFAKDILSANLFLTPYGSIFTEERLHKIEYYGYCLSCDFY